MDGSEHVYMASAASSIHSGTKGNGREQSLKEEGRRGEGRGRRKMQVQSSRGC
jgi:hypothetical protein